MKSDDIDRRDVARALALLPLVSLTPVAQAAYAPKFFSPAELELVATLGELILPQTDTPGARAAKAHEHIDLVLSEEVPDVQQTFRDGLARMEQQSRTLHNGGFLTLPPEQQNGLLARMASGAQDDRASQFFRDLRKRVVFAYYTSEVGLRQELTYQGKQAMGHWEGCPHPDHHGDAE